MRWGWIRECCALAPMDPQTPSLLTHPPLGPFVLLCFIATTTVCSPCPTTTPHPPSFTHTHRLTLNVRKMFQEIDGPLYERCRQQCEAEEQQREAEQQQRRRQWEAIELQAAAAAQRKQHDGGGGGGGNGLLPRR